MGDPERYRQKEEVERWQKDDPIGIFRRYLLEQEIANEGELDDLEMKVTAEVEDAVEFAESSPEPEPQALFEHIYADE
jgi:pyruvate dehydrogenase E1 component alpha subunit